MSMIVTVKLSDRDVELLYERMMSARSKAQNKSESETLAAARTIIGKLQTIELPDFIRERMMKLEQLTQMLEDKGWNLDGDDRTRIASALAYLVDPEDLVPDDIPGIGYLDDAIMIELMSKELQHDIDAYNDFLKFRAKEESRLGGKTPLVTQGGWLEARRAQLKDRMRRRRSGVWESRLRR